MGAFISLCGIRYSEEQKMFKIYKCHYIDKKTCIKWEIFGRSTEFTDKLAKRISKLGVYNLRRTKIGFCKLVYTEWPPYELEQAQEEYVTKIEEMNCS